MADACESDTCLLSQLHRGSQSQLLFLDREIVCQTEGERRGKKGKKKKAFFFLMIRARANVTKLASVIDKPRSYFRPEEHQIECVIKGGAAETEVDGCLLRLKKDGCFVKMRTGKETVLSLLFPCGNAKSVFL